MITPSAPPAFRFKATRQPLAWAAAAYSCGIFAGVYFWRPILWWLVAGAAFVAAAAYFSPRRSRWGWSLALGAFFLAGALHVQLRGSAPRLDTSIQPYANGQELDVTAHVTRDGRLQPGSFGEIRQTLDVETDQITTATGKTLPVHSGIRLSIYTPRLSGAIPEDNSVAGTAGATTPMPSFHYGERLRFSAKLKLPRNFHNPGAFDYQGYLADRGIAALASARSESVELLPGLAWTSTAGVSIVTSLGAWRSRLHRGVIAKVHQLWPAREAALIDAMVIGEEAFIDRDTRTDFQRSGTYHVLELVS